MPCCRTERRRCQLTAAGPAASPGQLAKQLAASGAEVPTAEALAIDLGVMRNVCIGAAGSVPLRFEAPTLTELLSTEFDLRHEALEPGFCPAPTPLLASLTQLAAAGADLDVQFDIQDLVKDL